MPALRSSVVVLWVLVLAGAAGCESVETEAPTGQLEVTAEIDFGELYPGGLPQTSSVFVTNVGDGPLILESLVQLDGTPVRFDGEHGQGTVFTVDFPGLVELPSGTSIELKTSAQLPPDSAPGESFAANLLLTVEGARQGEGQAAVRLRAVTAEEGLCGGILPSLDLAGVAVDDTGRASFEVVNPTQQAQVLYLGAPYSDSGDHLAFRFADGIAAGPIELPPGGSRTITVEFSPIEERTYRAYVKVRPRAECGEHTLELTGRGVDSVLTWSPTQVNCGFVPPGLQVTREVTFVNQGRVPVELSAIKTLNNSEFFVEGPSTLTVPASDPVFAIPGSATLRVGCKPASLGPRQTQLTFTTSLPKQPQGAVTVKVFGGGPDIEVSPYPSLDFGQVGWFPNATTPMVVKARIEVRNVGTETATLDPAARLLLGTPGDPTGPRVEVQPLNAATAADEFSVEVPISYDPAHGVGASAGKNLLQLEVTFTPKSLGAKVAELTILSNDLDEPEVKLTLTAEVLDLPPCDYTVTPAVLGFGRVSAPETRTRAFAITNNGFGGGDVCLVSFVELKPGSDAAFSLPDGAIASRMLQPQETLYVPVQVSPAASSAAAPVQVSGTVRFSVSSPVKPVAEVSLFADKSVLGCLAVAPDTWDFGAVQLGCASASRSFKLYNACTTPLSISGVTMAQGAGLAPNHPGCPGTTPCPEFTLLQSTSGSLPSTGAPLSFSVKYTPLDLGVDHGAISIAGIENGSPVTYVLPLRGRGDASGVRTDSFPRSTTPRADVLLIVDDSGSMTPYHQALASHVGALLSYPTGHNVDYRVAVTTTSFDSTGSEGRFVVGPTHPTKVITSATVNAGTMLAAKVQVGASGSGWEQPFAAALAAVTPPLAATDNAGFLRPDASFAVVAISDETDQSPRATAYYLDRFWNLKGHHRGDLFSFSSIEPLGPTCVGAPDARFAQVVQPTGGLQEDLCTSNWSGMVAQIGARAFGASDTFHLQAVPDTSSPNLEVQVDGVTVPASVANGTTTTTMWTYDPVSNAVTFVSPNVPTASQSVSLSYAPACLP